MRRVAHRVAELEQKRITLTEEANAAIQTSFHFKTPLPARERAG
jgi:hypothetical protein